MRTVLERYGGQSGIELVTAAYSAYLPPPTRPICRRRRRSRPSRRALTASSPNVRGFPSPSATASSRPGGIRWELDRYWPTHGVVVEVDSRDFHTAMADRATDELKRAKRLTVGIAVLSVSDWRIDYQIADALDDLEAIPALRRAG